MSVDVGTLVGLHSLPRSVGEGGDSLRESLVLFLPFCRLSFAVDGFLSAYLSIWSLLEFTSECQSGSLHITLEKHALAAARLCAVNVTVEVQAGSAIGYRF